jgi:hypothetical protein
MMKMDHSSTLTDFVLILDDKDTHIETALEWKNVADVFYDIVTYDSNDEMDKVCIDRVLTLFAAYFDTHNYIGDEEYNRFADILTKIRGELE